MLKAKLQLVSGDRAARLALGQPSTLRLTPRQPIDVVVENISSSGCLVDCAVDVLVGQPVSIGIGGSGSFTGQVVRVHGHRIAIAFDQPIAAEDLTTGQGAPKSVLVRMADHRDPLGTDIAGPDRPPVPLVTDLPRAVERGPVGRNVLFPAIVAGSLLWSLAALPIVAAAAIATRLSRRRD